MCDFCQIFSVDFPRAYTNSPSLPAPISYTQTAAQKDQIIWQFTQPANECEALTPKPHKSHSKVPIFLTFLNMRLASADLQESNGVISESFLINVQFEKPKGISTKAPPNPVEITKWIPPEGKEGKSA